jgi:hypothetical protein
MIAKTRNFVVASTMVLAAGLGTGLLAYYVGFPTGAAGRTGPEELQFVPANASLVAVADVHTIMTSPLRERLRTLVPTPPHGQEEFAAKTGIDIDTDIDRIVAAVTPAIDGSRQTQPLLIARGRFDVVKIEALMREHGGTVQDIDGKRVIVASPDANRDNGGQPFSLAFMEPGLIALGNAAQVRNAIALAKGGASVTTNEEMMKMIDGLDSGTAWAVGRFDELTANASLPPAVSDRIPPIQWFSASVIVDSGVRGTVRAETRDEASAENLREVVRGVMALARLQASRNPQIDGALQSLSLGGTGKTVALTFDVPGEIFDMMASVVTPKAQ